jgi:mannose-1-phosphate guanylyltransferase/quercetin dioxygenase-like cupin family protein
MQVVPVILAGGAGTRLWPLSKPGTPKQFLRLFGERTLLQDTLARAQALGAERIVIVTGEALQTETAAQVAELGYALPPPKSPAGSPPESALPIAGGLPGERKPAVAILTEPCARNTAPAVALAAAYVRDEFGPGAVLIVLPADHYVGDTALWAATLQAAVAAAQDGALVTLGVTPDRPETEYGYLKTADGNRQASDAGPASDDGPTPTAVAVERFVEKPDLATATTYLSDGGYYWNSGMFVWRADAILAALAAHLPAVAALAAEPWAAFQARFAEAPAISIDHGVLERASNVRMVPARFPWSDVGTWGSLAAQWRQAGRLERPGGVRAGRAAAGTSGAGAVPRVEVKPWGHELIWAETGRYVGKLLTVGQGQALSLQRHREKEETLHVLCGRVLLYHGENAGDLAERRLEPGESFHVPPGLWHRIEALADSELVEVSTPQLDDVIRLVDRYGR